MPNGRTHDKITLFVLPIIAITLYILKLPIMEISIISFGFVFASFMFNGDLDIKSSPYRRWGLLRKIWKPYQRHFHHRSIYTHGILIGTLIRLLYILLIPVILMAIISPEYIHLLYSFNAIILYIGLELGSAIHTISDYTYSFVKKWFK